MSKYRTKAGIECTEEECKLIDSFKRLAKKMEGDVELSAVVGAVKRQHLKKKI